MSHSVLNAWILLSAHVSAPVASRMIWHLVLHGAVMHLGIHGMRPFEQARADSQEDRQADWRAAAVRILESAWYQVERPTHPHAEGGAAESCELADIPQRERTDVELLIEDGPGE